RERDRSVFNRTACLNDPQVIEGMLTRIDEMMDGLADVRDLCLLYDLRDEPSVTSFLLASDACFCEHCMARMRDWLGERYADLDALNAEWDTEFGSWDGVEPLATLEALDRRDAGHWNFAPWADHRDFMNSTFARTFDAMTKRVKQHDPAALCGPCGTQCPAVFGGYDFAKIVPPTDWVEAYDFGGSVDCYRSFKPRRDFPILKTSGLGGGPDAARVMLWTYVYQAGGYSGTIIWNANKMIDVDGGTLEPLEGAGVLRDIFAELRRGVPKLLQRTDEVNSPVAVHYSQASINADFITSIPNRPVSVAGFKNENALAYKTRMAWLKLLEDRGLRPTFMSSAQIEEGRLAESDVRVLVLPRSIAISDREADAIRAFVEAGGTVLADSFIGRMDEHCRERETGALDDLFGVRRREHGGYSAGTGRGTVREQAEPGDRPRWGQGRRVPLQAIEEMLEPAGDDVAVMGCTEMTDAPVGIVAERGEGRAVLFNAAPIEYLSSRGSEPLQALFGGMLEKAGVEPLAEVVDTETGDRLAGFRVWKFRRGGAAWVGVAPDMEATQDALGQITVESGGLPGRTVTVRLSDSGHVYEARSGAYLGEGDAADYTFGPTDAPLFTVLPYRVEGLDLSVEDGVARAALRADGEPGEHVFRFDVYDADGRRLYDAGANVVAAGGAADWSPGTELPAGGKLACRDVATGLEAELDLG
ncbi:MAG: beta-galactosidase, partial [Planctomycetota bacterium]